MAFTPEWLTYEISEALSRIEGRPQEVARKEATVLRIAEAIANGLPLASVLDREETCSANTWHGYNRRKGKRKTGWKDEPAVTAALTHATERARWWVRVHNGRAVQDALDILVDGVEDAARQLVNTARYGYVEVLRGRRKMRLNAKLGDVNKAAAEVLDRVSVLTATKKQEQHTVSKEMQDMIERVYGDDDSAGEDEPDSGSGGDASGSTD